MSAGFLFEQDRCMGCHACQIACKEKNDLPAGQRWRRIVEFNVGGWSAEGGLMRPDVGVWYLSLSCNHCLLPACVDNCPTGALRRDPDGFVVIDAAACIGCAYCVWSCPYGAPQYDPARGRVGKCDGCADRVRQGRQPACVDACPVRALSYGALDTYNSGKPKGLPDDELTRPSLAVRPHRDALEHGRS